MSRQHNGSILLVNTFTPKPGKLDEFLKVQSAESRRLIETARVHGWRGSRLLRSLDRDTAIAIAAFESVEAHQRWIASADFSDHFKKIERLLERASPKYYEIAFQAGDI